MKPSNGILAEVNSHDFDSLRWLTGSDAARVYAEAANFKCPARETVTRLLRQRPSPPSASKAAPLARSTAPAPPLRLRRPGGNPL